MRRRRGGVKFIYLFFERDGDEEEYSRHLPTGT